MAVEVHFNVGFGMYDVGCVIYDVRFYTERSRSVTIYDLQCTICEVRFTIWDLRLETCDLEFATWDFRLVFPVHNLHLQSGIRQSFLPIAPRLVAPSPCPLVNHSCINLPHHLPPRLQQLCTRHPARSAGACGPRPGKGL